MRLKIVSIILFINLHTLISAQHPNSDNFQEKIMGISFSYGVENTLNNIANSYPELASRCSLAKLNFDLLHKQSISKMEKEVFKITGIPSEEYKMRIISLATEQSRNLTISKFESVKYLLNFENEIIHGNNDVSSQFISILLKNNPKYINSPIQEYMDGFKEKFTSNDHPKSKGLNFSIDYPKSWNKSEGRRPNIIINLISPDKKCNITVLIKDIFQEMKIDPLKIDKKVLSYIYSKNFEKDFIENISSEQYGLSLLNDLDIFEVSNLKINNARVDGQPSSVISASGKLRKGQTILDLNLIMYTIIYKNYLIQITSNIDTQNEKNYGSITDKNALCEIIINSLIIIDKWK